MFRSLHLFALVIAGLACLFATTGAAAMYDPGAGRFMQRDPHPSIYPDGLNAYAAYHVMWGGVDPSGLSFDRENPWRSGEDAKFLYMLELGAFTSHNLGMWERIMGLHDLGKRLESHAEGLDSNLFYVYDSSSSTGAAGSVPHLGDNIVGINLAITEEGFMDGTTPGHAAHEMIHVMQIAGTQGQKRDWKKLEAQAYFAANYLPDAAWPLNRLEGTMRRKKCPDFSKGGGDTAEAFADYWAVAWKQIHNIPRNENYIYYVAAGKRRIPYQIELSDVTNAKGYPTHVAANCDKIAEAYNEKLKSYNKGCCIKFTCDNTGSNRPVWDPHERMYTIGLDFDLSKEFR